jgi:hypothetical protein
VGNGGSPVEEKTMNQEIMNLFSPQVDQIRISIASPEKILSWSYGEIKKAGNDQLPDLQARA